MKRTIFTLFAAFTLILALPAVAQHELEDSRTNPDAPSIAPGSGLTIDGTVVEWNDEQLVIRSATEVETTTADTDFGRETDTFESESDLPATGSELPLADAGTVAAAL